MSFDLKVPNDDDDDDDDADDDDDVDDDDDENDGHDDDKDKNDNVDDDNYTWVAVKLLTFRPDNLRDQNLLFTPLEQDGQNFPSLFYGTLSLPAVVITLQQVSIS